MDLIKKTTKKIIAGVSVATTMVLGVLVYPIAPEPISLSDWQALSSVYNYEIQEMGGVDFTNIKKGDILLELNKKIRTRTSVKSVKINNVDITASDYELLREDLMNKVEKTNLLKKITAK